MSFDGVFLHYLTEELNNEINNHRIIKIYQLGATDFLLRVRSKETKELYISINPQYQRINLTKMDYEKPNTPYNFCMFLRKYLEGGLITNLKQYANDRILDITIQNSNELMDKVNYHFILEFTGKSSNLIITDENYTILDCVKRSPLDVEKQTRPGVTYEYTPQEDRINPFGVDKFSFKNIQYSIAKFIEKHFQGVSGLLAKEIEHLNEEITFIKKINVNPTVVHNKDKSIFYLFPISHVEGRKQSYSTISEMLDLFFYNKDKTDRIKQRARDLDLFIKKQATKLKNKIQKLELELKINESSEDLKIFGELIQANLYQITKGMEKVEVFNYYSNKNDVIELDPKLNGIQNMEKYYKRYKKQKKSIEHLIEQIQIAKNDYEYFKLLSEQIKHVEISGIDEIRQELENEGYLKKKLIKGKKVLKPNYETYLCGDTEILVGKNNIQNEYLTHKVAKRNEWWFHAKEMAGSHVVVRSTDEELSEELIRAAANLAAYYSKGQTSSSVPVNYTLIKNIKKIPGQRNCFVTYSTYKTIYIDPAFDKILELKKI